VKSGIPPNDSSAPGYFTPYSSPAVRYPDGTYGMDSWPIAHELEKRYPTPALYLDNLIVVQVRDHILKFMMPLLAHLLPSVPSLLNERSATYFKETRGKIFGVELEQMAKEATEEGWVNAEAPAREMGDWLRKNGGPYFLGETGEYRKYT
jgi:glutathione S-transferase